MRTEIHFVTLLVLLVLVGCATTTSFWHKTQQVDTIEAYQEFLRKYPQSDFTAEANRRIEKLTWELSQRRNTIEAYQEFLKKYPQSEYASKAKSKLHNLDWKRARQLDTVNSYHVFINKYPSSEFIQESKDRIKELDWEKTQQLNTREAYQDYLQKYPQTDHLPVAKRQIEKLFYENLYKKSSWESLNKLKEEGNVQVLSYILNDKSASMEWRERAALNMADIGDKQSVYLLIAVLRNMNESETLLRTVARALGNVGDKRAIEPLVYALRVYDFRIRRDIARVLDEDFGWKPKDNKEKAWYLVATFEWDEVTKLGSSATEPLVVALKADDWGWEIRDKAAKALSIVNKERTIEVFTSIILDKSEKKGRDALLHLKLARELDKLGALERNIHIVTGAYLYFIGKGESQELLIEALNQYGYATMATAYLNSKNTALVKAARGWARKHGYQITAAAGAAAVDWDSIR